MICCDNFLIMKNLLLILLATLFVACNEGARHDDGSLKYITVDFSKESSKERFAVNNSDGMLLFSCKCAHGKGGKSTRETPEFSNKIGSKCSCLGKFEIVGMHSRNGINYLELKGLDSSNSNARVRGICIHNSKLVTLWQYIPFFNIPLSNASEGCFAIDNDSMDKLIELYKNHKSKYIVAL